MSCSFPQVDPERATREHCIAVQGFLPELTKHLSLCWVFVRSWEGQQTTISLMEFPQILLFMNLLLQISICYLVLRGLLGI